MLRGGCASGGDEFEVVHAAQQKKQFGFFVEARADAIEGSGDVLAEAGPVGAGTFEFDFAGFREKAVAGLGDDAHDVRGKFPLQQFDGGSDSSRAGFFDAPPGRVQKRGNLDFDGVEFGAEEFYKKVEECIRKREIPDVNFSRVTYSQAGMFSTGREYLHVVKGEFIYDICAAPFAKGFFVSMWYVERPSVTKKMARKVPALQAMVDSKSYYQIDTDAMVKGAIHAGFNEAIEELTTNKGARALSETERKFF